MDRQQWDERYMTHELIWRAEPNRFLVEEVARMQPGRALDLACGEGRNALWLADQGWQVTGVDFSPVGLTKARHLGVVRRVDVTWLEADVLEWNPPEAAYDLVIVMYLQLPADARRRVLSRAASALAPGGTLLVVGHDSTNLTQGTGGPQDQAVLFSPGDVANDLPGLDIERAERVRRPVLTEHGEVDAIDALVRAVRASGRARSHPAPIE
jgi:SAM-dependent methyltransferase